MGSEASLVVLLNQVDTVPDAQRENLLGDLRRLLVDDGLAGVYVQEVSARSGEGVDEVRALLAEACARRSVAAGRAAAELDTAARLLLAQTPAEVPWQMEPAVERELGALVAATGLDAVASQVGATVRNGYGNPEVPPPDRDAITLSRARWLTRAGASLRPGWQRSLADVVQGADELRAEVASAMRGVSLEARGPAAARTMRRTAWALAGVAVVAAVVGVLALTGVLDLGDPWPVVVLGLAGVVAVAAAVTAVAGTAARRRLASRREQEVRRTGRAALERVLTQGLGEPTEKLLVEHRRVRELATAATELPAAAPLTGSVRLPTTGELASSSTGSAAQDRPTASRG